MYNGVKTRVHFPGEGFTLQEHMENTVGYSPVYDLVSVGVHRGTTTQGHYMTYCRSQGGRWWLLNDSQVQPVGVAQVLAERNAHLLFYETTADSDV
ncbi:uncharacterized protein [Panulirus ornatus]|uniref:uncharacterized protein n=1 Tax=Panulirus ornatus TaxID=150431 RepID=UPI003A8B5B11